MNYLTEYSSKHMPGNRIIHDFTPDLSDLKHLNMLYEETQIAYFPSCNLLFHHFN